MSYEDDGTGVGSEMISSASGSGSNITTTLSTSEDGFQQRVIRFLPSTSIVDDEDDEEEEEIEPVEVEIFDVSGRKPFLGGFIHQKTEVESHDASAQTRPIPRKIKLGEDGLPIPKYSRESQTIDLRSHSTQTNREVGTQMEKPGVHIDTSQDRIYHIPKDLNYMSGDEFAELKIQKIVKIQAMVRGWLARKRAKKMKEEYVTKREEEETFIREKKEGELRQRQDEIRRRMNPRNKKDFDLLYKELESWKSEKMRAVNKMPMGIERQIKLTENLRKETKLLQTIDRLKIRAKKENERDRVQKRMMKLSQPKKMKVRIRDGLSHEEEEEENHLREANRPKEKHRVRIENPLTIRSRELMDLYQGLKAPNLSIDERLDVLLQVKWTVKEFDCELTADIVDLIDREADLLNRGRKGKSMLGLRKRLSNLFLQFLETPTFNPAVKKLTDFSTKVVYKNTTQMAEKERKKRERRKRRLY